MEQMVSLFMIFWKYMQYLLFIEVEDAFVHLIAAHQNYWTYKFKHYKILNKTHLNAINTTSQARTIPYWLHNWCYLEKHLSESPSRIIEVCLACAVLSINQLHHSTTKQTDKLN